MKKLYLAICILFFSLSIDLYSRVEVGKWVNYARYSEYQGIDDQLDSHVPRIVFMGDSITENWKTFEFDGSKKIKVLSHGISGQTSFQMLLRFRSDVINHQPKVVVIMAGTNDIAGNAGDVGYELIQQNIASMVDLALFNGIQPILCSIPPVDDFYWREDSRPIEQIVLLNQWLRKYAESKNLIFVDYYTPFVDESGGFYTAFSDDGVHPNARGYLVMTRLLNQEISNLIDKF